MLSARKWAEEEFADAELGHVWRTRRLITLAPEVASRPAGTVTRACVSSASREGAFRLLENASVRPEAIRQCVREATIRRCGGVGIVFVPVDSTSLKITDTKNSKGIGSIGTRERGARGVHVMTALAVRSDGVPLGIVAQHLWARGPAVDRGRRIKGGPRAGGENVKWLEVLEASSTAFASDSLGATPWYQLDRGGDCWNVLQHAIDADILLTVRAVHDRPLDERCLRLWDTVARTPVLATKRIVVPARAARWKRKRLAGQRYQFVAPAQPARSAKVTIRSAEVPLLVQTPDGPRRLTYWAILVRERRPRTPSSDRIEWLLLTTRAIQSSADALEAVRGYCLRWRIEDFHRAWKTGLCRVEDTQLRSLDAIYKWATILAAVASRAMRLTHLARIHPDTPASEEFSKFELAAVIALRQPGDANDCPPTLSQVVRWVAEVAGHTGPWNGAPGTSLVARGLHDVVVAARALEFSSQKR